MIEGLEDGRLIVEHPNALPHPAVEVELLLLDGTPIKAVWSHIRSIGVAKLVTVHYMG